MLSWVSILHDERVKPYRRLTEFLSCYVIFLLFFSFPFLYFLVLKRRGRTRELKESRLVPASQILQSREWDGAGKLEASEIDRVGNRSCEKGALNISSREVHQHTKGYLSLSGILSLFLSPSIVNPISNLSQDLARRGLKQWLAYNKHPYFDNYTPY